MASVTATGEEAVRRKLDDDDVDNVLPADLEGRYDVSATVEWIGSNEYEVVGLQFPDGLLPHAIPVLRLLRRSLARIGKSVELYIMADTTYGSCCVDEVAAEHVSADAVVHYGHACMSS